MSQEQFLKIYVGLGNASVCATLAALALRHQTDAIVSLSTIYVLSFALIWLMNWLLPKRFAPFQSPSSLWICAIIFAVPIGLSAFILGALYAGASPPHFAATLLGVNVGQSTAMNARRTIRPGRLVAVFNGE